MNLFLLGWNLEATSGADAEAALRRMAPVYPQLDPATAWHREISPGTFAASMHNAVAALGPRRYRHDEHGELVLYDGSLIDRDEEFTALDAAELARHWDALCDRLQGQFVVARLTAGVPVLEVITDYLGMAQVYHRQHGNGWLVSNSVALIEGLLGPSGLDPLGVSEMMSMGWVGGDRTLSRDVRVIPGGERWRWRADESEPEREPYGPHRALACERQRRLPQARVAELAAKLQAAFARFAADYGECWCSLTGGRDSRVLLSLLLRAGIPARFYTSGMPGSEDVEYARSIAARFRLAHEIRPQSPEQVHERWEIGAERLVRQNDGLISLLQIADLLEQPQRVDHLTFGLWGVGGAISRGPMTPRRYLALRCGVEDVRRHLIDVSLGPGADLVCPDARQLVRDWVIRFVDRAADEGFAPRDIFHLFFVCERTRRWGGSNARKAMPVGDRFSPFCTREWVEAAFAQPVGYRYAEWLHSRLIGMASHELRDHPITGHRWRAQRPLVNAAEWVLGAGLRRAAGPLISRPHRPRPAARPPAYDHAGWLDSRRRWLRETCLDQPQSDAWRFVERRVFERVTGEAAPAGELRRRARELYHIATVFAAAG